MAVGRAGPTLGSLLLHTIPSLPAFSSARELRQWWFSFPELDALGDALSQKVFAAFARRPWWGIWCKDLPNFAMGAGDREVTSSLAPALLGCCHWGPCSHQDINCSTSFQMQSLGKAVAGDCWLLCWHQCLLAAVCVALPAGHAKIP